MKKEIELFDLSLDVMTNKTCDKYFNNEQVDITSSEYDNLRKMSDEQQELLERIEIINLEAKKIILLKQVESMLSMNELKTLLDPHYIMIDKICIEQCGLSHNVKRRKTTMSFYDENGNIFSKIISSPGHLKL